MRVYTPVLFRLVLFAFLKELAVYRVVVRLWLMSFVWTALAFWQTVGEALLKVLVKVL